jgi:hypothetical protein
MNRVYHPPLGITHEEAAEAYQEEGTFKRAAERLGCSKINVMYHVHQTTTKVRRSTKAFQHVRTPNGIIRVRMAPDEEPKDTVPPPTRNAWHP